MCIIIFYHDKISVKLLKLKYSPMRRSPNYLVFWSRNNNNKIIALK